MSEKVTELNTKIEAYCADNNLEIITNSNIRAQHLGGKKIHLSREGLNIFAGNIVTYLRNMKWFSTSPSTELKLGAYNRSNNYYPGIVNNEVKATAYNDAMYNIKSLRLKYTKNITVGHLTLHYMRGCTPCTPYYLFSNFVETKIGVRPMFFYFSWNCIRRILFKFQVIRHSR